MTNLPESVASVLHKELDETIERWMQRVDEVPSLSAISLTYQERTGHLPQLVTDLILRLGLAPDAKRPLTLSAQNHGKVRFRQGYSVPLLVEESRLLQVSLFDTLRRNQTRLIPGEMMQSVITIADECDAQLKDTVETFMRLENKRAPW